MIRNTKMLKSSLQGGAAILSNVRVGAGAGEEQDSGGRWQPDLDSDVDCQLEIE